GAARRRSGGSAGTASLGQQPLERRAAALAALGEREQVARQAVYPRLDAEVLGLQRDAAHDAAAPGRERAAGALDLVVDVAEAHGDAAGVLGAPEPLALALDLDLAGERPLEACGERVEERGRVARVRPQRRGQQI